MQRIVKPVTVERDAGILQESQLSKVYVQSCYNASNDSPTCHSFQNPYLSWAKNADSSCLFKPSIRKNQTWSRSITLDSGLIDSQDDQGLNAPPGGRLSYRRVMIEGQTGSDVGVNTSVVNAHYGSNTWEGENMTFSYANLADVSSDFQQSQIDAYELDIKFLFSGGFPGLSTFDPIPELRQQNGISPSFS